MRHPLITVAYCLVAVGFTITGVVLLALIPLIVSGGNEDTKVVGVFACVILGGPALLGGVVTIAKLLRERAATARNQAGATGMRQ